MECGEPRPRTERDCWKWKNLLKTSWWARQSWHSPGEWGRRTEDSGHSGLDQLTQFLAGFEAVVLRVSDKDGQSLTIDVFWSVSYLAMLLVKRDLDSSVLSSLTSCIARSKAASSARELSSKRAAGRNSISKIWTEECSDKNINNSTVSFLFDHSVKRVRPLDSPEGQAGEEEFWPQYLTTASILQSWG